MPSDATVLGFDTAGPWIAAAVVRGDALLAGRHVALPKGQGEALMPLLQEVLAEAGTGWRDLDALGVGTGPGNFTGIRIATAAARGLALGLSIPAVGVDRFEALALDGPDLPVAVAALRGQVWVRHPGGVPALADAVEGAVIGEGGIAPAWPLAVAIARLAAERFRMPQPRPAPLYLREADAAPPSDRPPALID
ncbi:MAG: tRNA (adenosine(37)-N6)-threonylcarbamoyltransferase complex dimerization subunit type 1 TsaB [Rhodobacteraceae bacterium]|nr:tRNA (adenosine(37)-N6)-threonylcarbamoyltransferase complex dimerization subunit type 1 TsaB [Paracoccaceae bacterium]